MRLLSVLSLVTAIWRQALESFLRVSTISTICVNATLIADNAHR